MTKKIEQDIKDELHRLDQILSGQDQLLIVVHNNPDPDAIAAAAALAYLAEKRCQVQPTIAYGGHIGRAENRTMVSKLEIPMKQFNRLKLDKYNCFALVDTQPGAGNHSFPRNRKCQIVIDHHPQRNENNTDLSVIKPDIGVSATILVEWLKGSELEIPVDLATALSYAIISETQNLGRETTKRDINAYLSVYVKSNMRKLAQILHPKLPRSYFTTLSKALSQTHTFGNLIHAHLGDVPTVEIVSEMADFLLRHERISWSFCTGRFKEHLYISVRTSNPKANAGKLVKKLVTDPSSVGGHDMLAGGYIPLKSSKNKELRELEDELTANFAKQMDYKNPDWKPILESSKKKKKNKEEK